MPELMQLLSGLQMAFTIWMLVDAYQRRADTIWFCVILFAFPFGPWVYFLAIKLGDFGMLRTGNWFVRRTSLDQLRYQAERVPTLASHLALAERLIERGEHNEALPYLESARKREPEHAQVLYLLAVCHTELNEPEQAALLVERIIARDRRWSDYSAWRLLVRVRILLNDGDGALEACRELERLAPTLQHRCQLAELLMEHGRHDEAYDLLEQSLEEHKYAPSLSRRRNRSWASQARRLQKRAAAGG
jgi:hypothetical protein